MARRIRYTLAAVVLSVTGAWADTDPHIGEIMVFGFDFCPIGWSRVDGSQQLIQSYIALFSLLGTNFGGNGMQTFGLPKQTVIAAPTASATAKPMTVCIAMTNGVFPQRP